MLIPSSIFESTLSKRELYNFYNNLFISHAGIYM